jgi:hypothetical protein
MTLNLSQMGDVVLGVFLSYIIGEQLLPLLFGEDNASEGRS